jgi:hypothetical protein
LFASLAGAGCAGTGQVGYSAHATVSTPDLVYVSPGVQVIADYDEPIFYSNNYYWRYDSGIWYRSPYHTRGWVRSYDVPVAIRRIDRPTAYIRYRGNNRTVIRDHRDNRGTYRQPPVVRDNRYDADERRRQAERQRLLDQRERERQQDRRELIQDRQQQQQRQQDRVQERREVIQERQEDQRARERQRLIDQRERQRTVERQRLIQQREREQRERERNR